MKKSVVCLALILSVGVSATAELCAPALLRQLVKVIPTEQIASFNKSLFRGSKTSVLRWMDTDLHLLMVELPEGTNTQGDMFVAHKVLQASTSIPVLKDEVGKLVPVSVTGVDRSLLRSQVFYGILSLVGTGFMGITALNQFVAVVLPFVPGVELIADGGVPTTAQFTAFVTVSLVQGLGAGLMTYLMGRFSIQCAVNICKILSPAQFGNGRPEPTETDLHREVNRLRNHFIVEKKPAVVLLLPDTWDDITPILLEEGFHSSP